MTTGVDKKADELSTFFVPLSSEPKPAPRLLSVQTQLGRELGSQQWRSKRLEKLYVFRSTGLDGNHPKLTGTPGGPDCEATINLHPLKKKQEGRLGNHRIIG